MLDRAADVFGGAPAPSEPPVDLKALHAKIGHSRWRMIYYQGGNAERKKMIDRTHELPVKRQATWVSAEARCSGRADREADLRLMRRIDELHLELPFAGSACSRPARGEGSQPGAGMWPR